MSSARWMIAGLSLAAALLAAAALSAAAREPAEASAPESRCGECHTCDVPTASHPCLKTCPRKAMVHQAGKHELVEAPESMLLDDLAERYQPVLFIHKRHAQMAEMGGNCSTCHHYSPRGQIPPCRECHAETASAADLDRPNLKGAYHRQCLSCHREWSHDTKCTVCHVPIQPGPPLASAPADPTDILGASHPPLTEPVTLVYRTSHPPAPVVTFQHREHIELFGFRCVDCHVKESCGKCHDPLDQSSAGRSAEERHAACTTCHAAADCAKCHDTRERPGFTHQTTGWPLGKYHEKLGCWDCHASGKPVSRLNRECEGCHAGWTPATFRHGVTGVMLGEAHQNLDCSDCHLDRNFEKEPVCASCHDDGRRPRSLH